MSYYMLKNSKWQDKYDFFSKSKFATRRNTRKTTKIDITFSAVDQFIKFSCHLIYI